MRCSRAKPKRARPAASDCWAGGLQSSAARPRSLAHSRVIRGRVRGIAPPPPAGGAQHDRRGRRGRGRRRGVPHCPPTHSPAISTPSQVVAGTLSTLPLPQPSSGGSRAWCVTGAPQAPGNHEEAKRGLGAAWAAGQEAHWVRLRCTWPPSVVEAAWAAISAPPPPHAQMLCPQGC